MKRLQHLSLATMITALLLSGCSTSTTVGQVNPSDTQQSNSSTVSSSTEITFDAETTAAFASLYENEGIFHDSEVIASQQSSFNTKGLLGDILSGTGEIVKKTLNGVGNIVEASLNLSADLISSLGRNDFEIKVSSVNNVSNTDGTSTKTIGINFTNKTNNNTKINKVAKTFLLNGSTKIEHALTVELNNYAKVSSRTVNDSSVNTTSSSKFTNGTTIEINENRNSNSGTGNVIIKKNNGTTSNYSFTSSVDVNGRLNITARDLTANKSFSIIQNSASQATVNLGANKTTNLSIQVASETYTNL